MINYSYSSKGERPNLEGKKVIDIGGATSFADGNLDAVIDIQNPATKANHYFVGDISTPEVWAKVMAHVKKHGQWDYAICTHTLEDITNPVYACSMIEQIAKEGLIIVPSKYRELSRFTGKYRGYMHHHWIFDIIRGELTAFPKINIVEDEIFDHHHLSLPDNEELIINWKGKINMKALNNGMPYRDNEHIMELYTQLNG